MRKALLALLFLLPAVIAAARDSSQLGSLVRLMEHYYGKQPDSLEVYALRALPLARNSGDISLETYIQTRRATQTFLGGHFDKAVSIFLETARKAEKHPPFTNLAFLYFELSGVYGKNGYLDISGGYIRKGLAIAAFLGNDSAYADGCNRIGVYYERKGLPDSALYFYRQALALNEKAGNNMSKAYSYENIAGIYGQRGDHRTALGYMKESLRLKESTGEKIAISIALINIGETFAGLRQFDSAIAYTLRAVRLAEDIRYRDLQKYSYEFLSGIYEKKGDLKTALDYHKRYSRLNDSIFNETRTQQLAELNASYQTEKKEQRIRALNQQNMIHRLELRQRNIFLVVSIILMFASILIGYLAYNRRKLKEEAELQIAINRQQEITTREVIRAEERERRRIAADLHDGVGQLLSAALMNLNGFFERSGLSIPEHPQAYRAMNLVTESYDELRQISHQMMPSALLKAGLATAIRELVHKVDPSRLQIMADIEGIDSRLNEETETVLYRIIQESITNVLKHSGADKLHIQLTGDEQEIALTIEDNGKGFDPRRSEQGIGLKNMLSRVQFLHGSIDIDSTPGRGTLIAIHVPLKVREPRPVPIS